MTSIRPPYIAALLIAFAGIAGSGIGCAQQSRGIGYGAIPRDGYSVIAEVRAKPGKADELRKITLPLISLVRSDPKCLVYFLQEDRESPGRFVFYEVWADRADFEAHNNMPYVKAWFTRLPALAEGEVKVTRMRVLSEAAK